ncbi:hypothetical protein L7F22_031950 [Adiantum nelumboides]|nr:hypothetical protein [Adiantum nelumboides]
MGRWGRHALGVAAVSYIALDYLREINPALHARSQPLLWGVLALAAALKAPWYRHWTLELRAAPIFLGCLLFMLAALCVEAIAVQFVTAVLGLSWHWSTPPLPDTGQWLLLALNEQLPMPVVEFLRAHLVILNHYLMLFLMLAFSVVFDIAKAPGLGLAARYMFTMGIGRLIRVLTFVATILPSARPWCAHARFRVPEHPHPWAQKFFTPYASDPNKVKLLLAEDKIYAPLANYPPEYVPNWGYMQFLVNFLRPVEPSGDEESWFSTLKRAGGGCNDLIYSGHILVSVLTAMAWTEANPGWTSWFIWICVLHSGQREIRERHHYSVDVVAGIYMGILLWKITSFLWSRKDEHRELKASWFLKMEGKFIQAAKDGDLDTIRSLLGDIQNVGKERRVSRLALAMFGVLVTSLSLGLALLAFVWTADG